MHQCATQNKEESKQTPKDSENASQNKEESEQTPKDSENASQNKEDSKQTPKDTENASRFSDICVKGRPSLYEVLEGL